MEQEIEVNTATRINTAERLGRWLGGVWRGSARLDRKADSWLRAMGFAPNIAKASLLAVQLFVLGALFYTMFWVALLLTFALAGAWIVRHDDGSYDEDHKSE